MNSRDERPHGLLAWQHQLYPENHTTRRNLLLHIFMVPLFLVGSLEVITALVLLRPLHALVGLGCMGVALAVEGRGHRTEPVAPVPFRGRFDALSRLFVEQWVTFPRFVLGGGFGRAWRAAK